MKRDARIGLAVLIVLGLGISLVVARAFHKSDEPAETEALSAVSPRTEASRLSVEQGAAAQARHLDQFITDHSSALSPLDDPRTPAAPNQPSTTLAPEAPSQPGWAYSVEDGDNPWKISLKLFGDGRYMDQIVSANPGVNPHRLRSGQTLRIPALPNVKLKLALKEFGTETVATAARQPAAAPAAVSAPASAAVGAPASAARESKHVVKSGETLIAIARQHFGNSSARTLKRIVDANPGLQADHLRVGQELKLPAGDGN